MMMTQKQYVNEILNRSFLPGSQRKKLREDLNNEINGALERGEYLNEIIEKMGAPDTVAADLFENYSSFPQRPTISEYKSKLTLFGLPLVHIIHIPLSTVAARGGINHGRIVPLPTACGIIAFGPKAKGFIACGNLAAGVISVGNLSAGLISIGNVSLGVINLGNIAPAFLFSIGNIAVAPLALGNLAAGYAAAGNLAAGVYAVGNKAVGAHALSVNQKINLETLHTFTNDTNLPGHLSRLINDIYGFLTSPSSLPYMAAFTIGLVALIILMVAVVPLAVSRRKKF